MVQRYGGDGGDGGDSGRAARGAEQAAQRARELAAQKAREEAAARQAAAMEAKLELMDPVRTAAMPADGLDAPRKPNPLVEPTASGQPVTAFPSGTYRVSGGGLVPNAPVVTPPGTPSTASTTVYLPLVQTPIPATWTPRGQTQDFTVYAVDNQFVAIGMRRDEQDTAYVGLSPDLRTWTAGTDFRPPTSPDHPRIWAPHVFTMEDGAYVAYTEVKEANPGWHQQIRFAKLGDPANPGAPEAVTAIGGPFTEGGNGDNNCRDPFVLVAGSRLHVFYTATVHGVAGVYVRSGDRLEDLAGAPPKPVLTLPLGDAESPTIAQRPDGGYTLIYNVNHPDPNVRGPRFATLEGDLPKLLEQGRARFTDRGSLQASGHGGLWADEFFRLPNGELAIAGLGNYEVHFHQVSFGADGRPIVGGWL